MGFARSVIGLARRGAAHALDALLPPLCLSCRAIVDAQGALCAACWSRIAWLGPPLCDRCGLPFEFDPAAGGAGGERLVCGACLRDPPSFDRARSVFRYDAASRGLVIGYKHADQTHATGAYARWMARAGAELLADADLVAPVPLHWLRLALRRYNQAALLARDLARMGGRPYAPDLLQRVRYTPRQGTLGRAARRRNVRRAFRVHPGWQGRIGGARVVLVDDVFTTGATVEECARVLGAAGAAAVGVLTLARVVRPAAA